MSSCVCIDNEEDDQRDRRGSRGFANHPEGEINGLGSGAGCTGWIIGVGGLNVDVIDSDDPV